MGKSAPAPTDPKDVSSATTGTNYMTSLINTLMGNFNETGPYGSKTTTQTGTQTVTDPYTGQTYEVPTYTTDVSLNADQQGLLDTQTAAKGSLATTGAQLAQGLLGMGNFNMDTGAIEGRLAELGQARLDPMLAQRQEALRTQLANQGISQGSDAYNQEMARFDQGSNDAYNQLFLTGRQQAGNELLGQRQMQLSEIQQLLGGSGVAMPSFMTGAGASPMAGTNNAGIIQGYDNANMNQWMQNQNMWGKGLGGLGGLFGL